jgi:hypothetical protein
MHTYTQKKGVFILEYMMNCKIKFKSKWTLCARSFFFNFDFILSECVFYSFRLYYFRAKQQQQQRKVVFVFCSERERM